MIIIIYNIYTSNELCTYYIPLFAFSNINNYLNKHFGEFLKFFSLRIFLLYISMVVRNMIIIIYMIIFLNIHTNRGCYI